MGYGKEIHEAVKLKLHQRQINAESKARKRRQEFFSKYPRAKEIEYEISKSAVLLGKAVLAGSDVKQNLIRLKNKNIALQIELELILKEAGLSKDYLSVHYTCSLCNDKGYIDGRRCECMNKLLREESYRRINALSPMSLSSFEDFNLEYYSDISAGEGFASPRKRMTDIFNFCKSYANNFSLSSKSLLLQGGTGLGKTHLSLSIAKVVIDKGYGVIYGSAPNLLSTLEKEKFNKNKGIYDNDNELHLITCDLLILDDLGTEFLTSFSSAAIYNIINSRMMTGRPAIISTNLSIKELERCYTERFVSRIMGEYARLKFLGKDVRQITKSF